MGNLWPSVLKTRSITSVKDKKMVLKFKYTRCSKIYVSKHGALCHMPKCKGSKEPITDNALTCDICGKGYVTARRLSQHDTNTH
jgi:hypothetical protein